MNFLAQSSDRIHHFTVYNLMPLGFLTKYSGVSYLIFELDDSGQPEQGMQPKNKNNSKPQMYVILLASMCIARILFKEKCVM